jgi:hypothetical protein
MVKMHSLKKKEAKAPDRHSSPLAKMMDLKKIDVSNAKGMDKYKLTPQKQLKAAEKVGKDLPEFELKEQPKEPDAAGAAGLFWQDEKSENAPAEAVAAVLKAIVDPKNIRHFTQLNDAELKGISALAAVNGDKDNPLHSPTLAAFLTEFENLRVSTDRRGREDLKDIAKAALSPQDQGIEKKMAGSIMDRLKRTFGDGS